MAELMVATHHLIQERAQVNVGDDVVIVGPGPMGIVATQYAKICGARRVILIGLKSDEMRLAIGRQVGADVTLYAEENPGAAVMEITGGKGRGVRAGMLGQRTRACSTPSTARARPTRGRAARAWWSSSACGASRITVNLDQVSLGQLDIRGSWSWNGRETWEHAVDLLDRGLFRFEPMITGHYALDQWETAFANLRAKQELKAMFLPNGAGWIT